MSAVECAHEEGRGVRGGQQVEERTVGNELLRRQRRAPHHQDHACARQHPYNFTTSETKLSAISELLNYTVAEFSLTSLESLTIL